MQVIKCWKLNLFAVYFGALIINTFLIFSPCYPLQTCLPVGRSGAKPIHKTFTVFSIPIRQPVIIRNYSNIYLHNFWKVLKLSKSLISSKMSGINNLSSPFFAILLKAFAQPLRGFFRFSFLSLDWKIFFIV